MLRAGFQLLLLFVALAIDVCKFLIQIYNCTLAVGSKMPGTITLVRKFDSFLQNFPSSFSVQTQLSPPAPTLPKIAKKRGSP